MIYLAITGNRMLERARDALLGQEKQMAIVSINYESGEGNIRLAHVTARDYGTSKESSIDITVLPTNLSRGGIFSERDASGLEQITSVPFSIRVRKYDDRLLRGMLQEARKSGQYLAPI